MCLSRVVLNCLLSPDTPTKFLGQALFLSFDHLLKGLFLILRQFSKLKVPENYILWAFCIFDDKKAFAILLDIVIFILRKHI